jgi:hypothetical protein
VQIRAHDFGGLSGVAALDPSQPDLTATYLPLIKALQEVGYVERESLWGAPYDWRLAGDALAARGVAEEVKALIEMAVSALDGTPAVVISHSMVTHRIPCLCTQSCKLPGPCTLAWTVPAFSTALRAY